jgi:two-component system NtrC family sensor kinase
VLPAGASRERPDEPTPVVADAGSRSILVVDDEPEVAATLGDLLATDGYLVDVVTSGAAALARLEDHSHDVILSDIRMPGLNGPQFHDEVRRRWPDLADRFVFVTGDTLSRETVQFLDDTRAPHVSKPVALEDVRRALRACLRARRAAEVDGGATAGADGEPR